MDGCRLRAARRAHVICVSLAALAACGASAGAQEEDGGLLDEITITAARTDRPTSDIPQTVQVVGRKQIDEQLRLTGNAATALSRLIPGYSVSTGTISSASETFRGRNVLIMLDGVPLNTPLRDVSRLAALIDLNALERIEVVAGASSLYGSNATGGTINFITRKATAGPPTVTAGATLRAFTADLDSSLQPELTASLTGKSESGFDYVFTGTGKLADKTYDGDGRELPSDALLGQGGSDRFEAGNLLGKLGYDFGQGKRFELSASTIYLDQEPDWLTLYSEPYARPDFSSPYAGKSIREDSQFYSARYSDEEFALGRLSLVGFYNDIQKRFNYTEFDINYNGSVYYSGNLGAPTAPFNQTTLYSERLGSNLTIDTPLDGMIDGGRLTWGGDIVNEKTHQTLTNDLEVFNPLEQTGYAAFAQLQVPFGDRITLRGGVRHEYLDLTVEDFVRPSVFVGFPGLGYALLPELPVEGGKFDYEATTFNIGGTLKLAETAELYGGFSQG
ncbi:MAG: TonB-dependent receptor, partial [Parvibaculaceae bacterium]